jgi:hypothetical protein
MRGYKVSTQYLSLLFIGCLRMFFSKTNASVGNGVLLSPSLCPFLKEGSEQIMSRLLMYLHVVSSIEKRNHRDLCCSSLHFSPYTRILVPQGCINTPPLPPYLFPSLHLPVSLIKSNRTSGYSVQKGWYTLVWSCAALSTLPKHPWFDAMSSLLSLVVWRCKKWPTTQLWFLLFLFLQNVRNAGY